MGTSVPGWLPDAPPQQPLATDVRADVAIVGAGLTGLSVAYHLKRLRPECQVVVLERRRIGYGASGRASGFIAPEVPTWMRHYRRRRSATIERLRRWGEQSQRCLQEMIEKHQIDCDLQRRGVALLAAGQRDEQRLQARYRAYAELGITTEWWRRDEVTERIGSRFYVAGLFHPGWSLVDPGRLITGLAELCRRRGVRFHEGTEVVALRDRGSVELDCGTATVQAAATVLATNSYTPRLGFLRTRLLPVHLAVAVTAPLEGCQLELGGWGSFPGRTEVNHSHTLRLDGSGRVLIRGGARYLFGNRIDERSDAVVTRRLLASLSSRHPELTRLECESSWSGAVAIVRSPLPLVGRLGSAGNIHCGVGYNGYGLAGAFFAGRLLAHRIADQASGDEDLMTPIEEAGLLLREPLRSAVVKSLLAVGRRLRS